MLDWFRRLLSPGLPLSSKELTDALRAAAKLAEDDSARIEYTAAADALDRATSYAKRHGDKSVRDDVFYALGRAQVDLRDQISELVDVNRETHILMQEVHLAQRDQGAAVTELRAGFQTVGEYLSDLNHWRGRVEGVLASFSESRDRSLTDRAMLREDMDASKAHRARMQTTLDTELPKINQELSNLAESVQRIEQLLAIAGQHEAGG